MVAESRLLAVPGIHSRRNPRSACFFRSASRSDNRQAAGEGVVLTAASNASHRNALAIIERTSGKVWWSRDNEAGRNPLLGVFVIQNESLSSVSLVLMSAHQPEAADREASWIKSAHRRLNHEDYCEIVGFEDSYRDSDWDDVRVNLHWLQ